MTIHYNMRGKDVDCITLTYREWTVIDTPDTTGASYIGPKCGGSLLADIIVVSYFNDNLADPPELGSVVNASVNASAAIDGTKINPNFGSQNIITTGTITASSINALVNISGLTTTGVTDGYFGYLSSADTVSKTNATSIASSRLFGVNEGVIGSMTVSGVILDGYFTTAGDSPSVGAPVYLAPATEEAGASGKLTATKPTTAGQVVAEVGIVMNNSNYASAKTCKILLQVKAPIQL